MKDYLTIGEVAKITNLPVSTLRYYDSEGIISPSYKDEETNYRYYRFFQIPIIKMIIHLKNLGFNNASIKSHLENLSYSHTLELMNQMLEQTKNEISRLKKLEKELEENVVQMKQMIKIENNINKLFIEEEEITGIYADILPSEKDEGLSKAFKELDLFISSKEDAFLPIGMCAFTIKKENIESQVYKYDKLVFLKDFPEYKNRCKYPKQHYVSLICQTKFDDINKKIEKILKWIKENEYEIVGDSLIHILSGPAFEKNPEEAMYILKVPIKIKNIQI